METLNTIYRVRHYIYAVLGLTVATVAVPIIVAFALVVVRVYYTPIPKDLPWAGLQDKRWLPKLRAALREMRAGRAPHGEGYAKYGKYGKAYILPQTHGPTIVLPPSNVPWMVSQPDSILSGPRVQDDDGGLEYFAHGPNIDSVHDFSLIRKDLTRQLGRILPASLEEIDATVTEHFGGVVDEWKEVPLFKAMLKVSSSVVHRVFFGAPTCHDSGYEKAERRWVVGFAIAASLYRYCVPACLRSWLGPVLALPLKPVKWLASRRLSPVIRQRLAARKALIAKPDKSEEGVPARENDMVQWMIESAARKEDVAELDPANIVGKLMLFNIFAEHTTSLTVTTVLIDILSSPEFESLVSELRNEAETIMPTVAADPRRVREMVKLDSVIRESLRFNPMAAQGLRREVMQAGGITTPDGLWLPQGSRVATNVLGMQRDDNLCKNASEYRPLRFYHAALGGEANSGFLGQVMAVQTSDRYLSFSRGIHECPGRFFTVQAMKMVLGYLLVNYDFESFAERPKFTEISEAAVPSDKTKVRARRRKAGQGKGAEDRRGAKPFEDGGPENLVAM